MIGRMNTVLDELRARDRAISRLVEDYAATQSDLIDVGLTRYAARKEVDSASPRELDLAEFTQIPPLGLPDMVALIPLSDDLGRRYLEHHGVYIHDAGLRYQIRLRATHIGWSDNGRIEVIRPVARRWRIGSGAAVAAIPSAAAAASEPGLLTTWPGPATLVELGPPVAVGLPLGWNPGANGAAPALRRILHYPLADLLATARSGGTLADLANN
jgi:hypothetical protein